MLSGSANASVRPLDPVAVGPANPDMAGIGGAAILPLELDARPTPRRSAPAREIAWALMKSGAGHCARLAVTHRARQLDGRGSRRKSLAAVSIRIRLGWTCPV